MACVLPDSQLLSRAHRRAQSSPASHAPERTRAAFLLPLKNSVWGRQGHLEGVLGPLAHFMKYVSMCSFLSNNTWVRSGKGVGENHLLYGADNGLQSTLPRLLGSQVPSCIQDSQGCTGNLPPVPLPLGQSHPPMSPKEQQHPCLLKSPAQRTPPALKTWPRLPPVLQWVHRAVTPMLPTVIEGSCPQGPSLGSQQGRGILLRRHSPRFPRSRASLGPLQPRKLSQLRPCVCPVVIS